MSEAPERASGGQAWVPGRCLCGVVRFEVSPPTLFCAHCHCTMCRRHHGAGYVTWFGILKDRFRVTAGASDLVHHRSSDRGTRSFCGRCGTSLFFESTEYPDKVDVTLASMEGPIDRSPELHVHYDNRVPWVSVDDGLPRLGGESGMEPVGTT